MVSWFDDVKHRVAIEQIEYYSISGEVFSMGGGFS